MQIRFLMDNKKKIHILLCFVYAAHINNEVYLAENLERLGNIAKRRDNEEEISK